MSDPTARVVDMLRVAHEALAPEGVTVSWRRLPDAGGRTQDEMKVEIVRQLVSGLPDDWAVAHYGATLIGEDARDELRVTGPDGQSRQVPVPGAVRPLVAELKRAMWTPEQGTWFGLVFTIDRAAGQVSPGFNHDIQPGGVPFRWRAVQPRGLDRRDAALPPPGRGGPRLAVQLSGRLTGWCACPVDRAAT